MSKDGWEAVHEQFGLTYANYLVWPRSILQCMPNDWQLRFAALVDELEQTFDTSGNYRVLLLDHDDRYEDNDTPDAERARVVDDPLADYRYPDWRALSARRIGRVPEGEG